MTHFDFIYCGSLQDADDSRIEYLKKFSRASITWRGEHSHAFYLDVRDQNLLPVGISAFLFGDYSNSLWQEHLADARVTAIFGKELEPFTIAMRNGLEVMIPQQHPAYEILSKCTKVHAFGSVADFYTKAESLLEQSEKRYQACPIWEGIVSDPASWDKLLQAFGYEPKSEHAWSNVKNAIEDRHVIDQEIYQSIIREKGWQYKEETYLNEFEWFKQRECEAPQISIVIISFEYNPDVLVNLEKLSRQPGHQLIFVNNGGTEEEFAPIADIPDVYLKLKENKGAYLARNAGAVFAKAPVILFLDDDALPEDNLVATHIDHFNRYDIVSLRGVCLPRTDNPYNGLPRHYYLGDEPFPRFANIEGNTSYLSGVFFKADGWSDDIRFGGGGLDLALKILKIDPDLRKHMYSPEPVIYHDYVHDAEHLEKKSAKQQKSRRRLFRKYPDHLEKVNQWNQMRHKTELLYLKMSFTHETGVTTIARKNPRLYRLLQVRTWEYKFGYYDFYWSHEESFNPPAETSISVVLVTEKPDELMISNIEKLRMQDSHLSIVVVNNGGNPANFANIGCHHVVHLSRRANQNTARNIGSLMVKSPVILFLGNHCIPSDNLIQQQLEIYVKYQVACIEGEILHLGEKPAEDQRTYSLFPIEEDHISFSCGIFNMAKGFSDHIAEQGIHDLNLRMQNILSDLSQTRHAPGCYVFSNQRRAIKQVDIIRNPIPYLNERPSLLQMYQNWLNLGDKSFLVITHETARNMNKIMDRSSKLISEEKYEEAISGFEQYEKINPLNYQCSSFLSYSFMKAGNLEKALATILPAVEMLPLSVNIAYNHVGILIQMKRVDEAFKVCIHFLSQINHVHIQKILIDIEKYLGKAEDDSGETSVVESTMPEQERQLLRRMRESRNDPMLLREVYHYLRNVDESEALAIWYMNTVMAKATVQPPSSTPTPKVTVIVPCHNYGEYLRECVHSVICQTYTDWEMIIVNDGSTDNTAEVAGELLREFEGYRIRYHKQECHGIVQPRNWGAGNARGEYILPLDADDLLAPKFLEMTVPILDHKPDVAYVSTKALFFGISNKIWPQAQFKSLNLPVTNQQTNTTLFRKIMWDDLGGWDERMNDGYVDWEFWIRGTKRGWLGEQLDACLFFYRRKGDSTVMAAKNKGPRLKLKIMALHPDIYQANGVSEDDPRLARKNFIDPQFIRQDFRLPERKAAPTQARNPFVLRIEPQKSQEAPRILFICHDFPPYRMAGAQLYALNLAKKLNQTGKARVDVLYAVWRNPAHLDYTIRESSFEGLRVYELGKPPVLEPMKVFDEKTVPAVRNLLKKNRYQAVHIHGLGQITLAPALLAKEMGLPLYATLHDYWLLCDHWHMIRTDQSQCSGPTSADKCAKCYIHDYMDETSPEIEQQAVQYQEYRRGMMRKLFSSYDRMFAPSRYLASRFAEFGFKGIEVAPLGFEYGEVQTRRPGDGLFHFGYTGQMIPRKGVNFMIEAFMQLPHENARLDLYGPIEDIHAQALQQQASRDRRIRFHGRYEPEQLDAIMRTFDMAVVPSLMENYPLVVQEAFLRRTPVIATSVGGIPEVVIDNENGYLVQSESVESILQAMKKVLSDPSCVDRFAANIQPVRRLGEDAEFYSDVYAKKKPRAMFYFFKNVHVPILMQLYRQFIKTAPHWEVGFSFLPSAPQIRAGFTVAQIQSLELPEVTITRTPQEFKPDITFIADSAYPWVKNCGKLVHIGHGVLSKGQYYTNTPIVRRDDAAALVCVPGSIHRANLRGVLQTRVEVTGMAKLDPLFGGEISRDSAANSLGVSPHRKYILFAPTFNDELSAIPFVGIRIQQVLPSDDYTLLIKLHGSAKKEYVIMYQQLAERNTDVVLIDDLIAGMALADVMISDVSSAMMEFAALDKPVVLFDNPHWAQYKNYNPSDIDFRWRDIGIRVKDVNEMRMAVIRSLQDPQELSQKRKHYTDQLFANKYDGKASERIVAAALSLVEKALEKPKPTKPVSPKRETNAQSDTGVRFTYVGDFSKDSGVDVMLEAFRELPQEGWTLTLHGDQQTAWDQAEFSEIIRQIPRVQMMEEVDRKRLNDGSVMIIPSRAGNHNHVIREALRKGVPVIASEGEGVRDVLQDRVEGFIVPSGDSIALRRVLNILVNTPELLKLMERSVRQNHAG